MCASIKLYVTQLILDSVAVTYESKLPLPVKSNHNALNTGFDFSLTRELRRVLNCRSRLLVAGVARVDIRRFDGVPSAVAAALC